MYNDDSVKNIVRSNVMIKYDREEADEEEADEEAEEEILLGNDTAYLPEIKQVVDLIEGKKKKQTKVVSTTSGLHETANRSSIEVTSRVNITTTQADNSMSHSRSMSMQVLQRAHRNNPSGSTETDMFT